MRSPSRSFGSSCEALKFQFVQAQDHHLSKQMSNLDFESHEYKKQFMHEATRLAIDSVEKGWGGPFGAVIVKHGKVIGRGQNRVLLTGIPVYHAEVTAIIDASLRLNSKALLGSG